jgi:hypothetical protein
MRCTTGSPPSPRLWATAGARSSSTCWHSESVRLRSWQARSSRPWPTPPSISSCCSAPGSSAPGATAPASTTPSAPGLASCGPRSGTSPAHSSPSWTDWPRPTWATGPAWTPRCSWIWTPRNHLGLRRTGGHAHASWLPRRASSPRYGLRPSAAEAVHNQPVILAGEHLVERAVHHPMSGIARCNPIRRYHDVAGHLGFHADRRRAGPAAVLLEQCPHRALRGWSLDGALRRRRGQTPMRTLRDRVADKHRGRERHGREQGVADTRPKGSGIPRWPSR